MNLFSNTFNIKKYIVPVNHKNIKNLPLDFFHLKEYKTETDIFK